MFMDQSGKLPGHHCRYGYRRDHFDEEPRLESSDVTPIQAGSAIVLGSINVDTFIHVEAFPQPGETVLARPGAVRLGGKGANQAMAAAILGTDVHFLAQIGRDSFGDFAREQLKLFGVGISC